MRPLPLSLALVALFAGLAAACAADVNVTTPAPAPTATSAPAPDHPTALPDDPADPPDDPTALADDPGDGPDDPADPVAVVIEGRYEWEEGDCPFTQPTEVEITCGTLTVPEDWDDPDDTETVEIAAAVFEGPGTDPAPDPVVYLEGGPGGDALETVQYSFDTLFRPFLADREVIIWDQRGTGYSSPSLACPEADETDIALDQSVQPVETELAAELEAFTLCADRVRADSDVTTYNSVSSAHDAEALRLALGYDQWNLMGISYGTRLGQTMMREHPDGIRSVILDSVVPLEGNLDAEVPANAQRSFGALFAGCAADPACAAAYPDLEDRLRAVVRSADETPVAYEAVNPLDGERFDFVADGGDITDAIFGAMYSQDKLAAVPELVVRLEQGDPSGLALLRGEDLATSDFFSSGMLVAVRCHEEHPFVTDEILADGLADDPFYNDYFAGPGLGEKEFFDPVCAVWSTGSADPVEEQPIDSDLPTLVLAGHYDPVTPPIGGEEVAAGLTASSFYVFPHQGHAALSDECAQTMAMAFLTNPSTPLDDSCIATSEPPAWVGSPPPASYEDFSYDESFVTGRGVFPTGWEDGGSGVFVSPDNSLQQLILIQQAIEGIDGAFLIQQLGESLGSEEPPVQVETVTAGGKTWTRFRFSIPGATIDGYVADIDGGVLFVGFQGPATRIPSDSEPLALALLEAFEAE